MPRMLEVTDIQQQQAELARLVRLMPLSKVLNIVATMLADRPDLRGHEMQEFQRRIADLTWPLISVDEIVRDENASATAWYDAK